MKIVKLEDVHVDRCVGIHLSAFPKFFLSSLGERFLREFYRGFLGDQDAIAIVAEDCGNVFGVVVGTANPHGFFKRLLLRRLFGFAVASAVAICRRPAVARRIARAVLYRGGQPVDLPGYALLSSICTRSDVQNNGIGRRMVSNWVAEAQRRGAVGAYLVTDAVDNDAVNGFYRSCGWHIHSAEETPEKRLLNCYVLPFSTATNQLS